MFYSVVLGVVIVIVLYYVIDLVLRSLNVGKVTNKHVLITGCDSGFGRLAASRLDQLGFNVFAACLTKDGAQSLSETCSSRLTTLILDVASTESIEQAVSFVQEKLPSDTGLWAVINNAGILGLFAPTEFCSRQDIMTALNINLLGPIDVTCHFLPLLRKGKGRVVNTTSVAGRLAFLPTPYTVSKYGTEGFSDRLRREVSSQGIKVSVVQPGAFKTQIYAIEKKTEEVRIAFEKQSPDVQAIYGGRSLMKTSQDILMNTKQTSSEDLGLVVDAYIHAITSKFPKTRYVVGTDARRFFLPISFLPDSVADFLLARLM